MLDLLLAAAGVAPVLTVPEEVEATVRTAPDGRDHLFLLNHGHRAAQVALPDHWRGARDLLTGTAQADRLTLGPLDAAVLLHPRTAT